VQSLVDMSSASLKGLVKRYQCFSVAATWATLVSIVVSIVNQKFLVASIVIGFLASICFPFTCKIAVVGRGLIVRNVCFVHSFDLDDVVLESRSPRGFFVPFEFLTVVTRSGRRITSFAGGLGGGPISDQRLDRLKEVLNCVGPIT
jgi:hypothetical protein